MEILIITGMSGAGKSKAVDALEDMGYFCVDNIPPDLISNFVDLYLGDSTRKKVAIVTDSRSGQGVDSLLSVLNQMRDRGIVYQILFLDCGDQILLTRFKETRRKHPFLEEAGGSLEAAIAMERGKMNLLRQSADQVVDTSLLSISQLRVRIQELFLEENQSTLLINCMSFGFKYGLPREADLVFDVRCLPNPFYIPELKQKTGLDSQVQEYVLGFPEAGELLAKLKDLIGFLLPLYQMEGKTQLVIAIGCTGGKHRSVTFAGELNAFLIRGNYHSIVTNRDITKD